MNAKSDQIDIIYDQSQSISLKIKGGHEMVRELRIIVSFLSGHVQMLSLHIIDEDNSTLLYLLKVTDIEYEDLKKKQGFLVDFFHFSEQLVKILEECKISKFILLVEDDEFGCQKYIKVIEENQLKQICHLSLILNEPNSDELKMFLIDKIKLFKGMNEMLHKELNIALARMIDFQSEFTANNAVMQEEIGNEGKRFEEIKQSLMQEFKTQIAKLRIIHFKVMSKLRTANLNLRKKNGQQKETLRKQKLEILQLQKELIGDKEHLDDLHKRQHILDHELSQKTKLAADLRMELAEMQEKARKAEVAIKIMEDKIDGLIMLKNSLEENVKKKENILTKKVNALKTVSHGLYTTKASIQTLEEENKSLDDKLKEASNKILQQEATITQKNQEIAVMTAQVKEQCTELQRLSLVEKEKSEQLLEMQNKEKILKYQTTVICQLQRKITQLEAELVESQKKSRENFLHLITKAETFERSAPVGAELSSVNSARTPLVDQQKFSGRAAMVPFVREDRLPNYAKSSTQIRPVAIEGSSSCNRAKEDSAAVTETEDIQQVASLADKVNVEKGSGTGLIYPASQSLQPNERKRHPIPFLAPSTYFSASKINK